MDIFRFGKIAVNIFTLIEWNNFHTDNQYINRYMIINFKYNIVHTAFFYTKRDSLNDPQKK